MQTLAQLDIDITTALFTLGHDVALGRSKPTSTDHSWKARRPSPDFAGTLGQEAIAKYVLRGSPEWDESRIQAAMNSGLTMVAACTFSPTCINTTPETDDVATGSAAIRNQEELLPRYN